MLPVEPVEPEFMEPDPVVPEPVEPVWLLSMLPELRPPRRELPEVPELFR